MPLDPRSRIRDIVSKMFGAETARAPVNMPGIGRLVIVSNRVATVAQMKTNPGGLAVAMAAALREHPAMWFGSSGEFVDHTVEAPKIQNEGPLIRALLDLPRSDYDRYYAGFSNGALWPLFHYRVGVVNFSHDDYAAYLRVNEEFARHLIPLLQPDDVIWIHDYQLIPLAGMLRARGVTQKIGFFLHIPFPAPEILTTLPVHEEIARALAQYDLVGFQTQTDQASFTDYIQRERREQAYAEGWVQAFGRRFRVGTFPISIDPEIVAARARRMAGGTRNKQLRDSLSGRKLMIGVDRLDYTKGLDRRFQAIEHLFEEHEEHRRGVVVLQIAPPTRGDVPEYRRVRAELNALIGHINGQFGDADILPIRYLNRQFSQDILFGYFRISRAALVTPLRDGMNLVAKEFVACQDPDDPGIPVLSRFAGAAKQMDAAMIVNPFDVRGMAGALHRVLEMPIEERRERHQSLLESIRGYDIHRWRDAFISELTRTYEELIPSREEETVDLFSLAGAHH
ncbi:MAG TPA: trehalose-6-phosphate synthase [Magnetospirillaceae bacterium]